MNFSLRIFPHKCKPNIVWDWFIEKKYFNLKWWGIKPLQA